MVLVAGLDRLKGTRVGPWLTDAEWQDHTRELRERFDAGQGDYLLREHCSSVGDVASVELLMRGYNGTVPTGSAVVQYYSASAASSAIKDLNGTELDGRRLYVRAYFT